MGAVTHTWVSQTSHLDVVVTLSFGTAGKVWLDEELMKRQKLSLGIFYLLGVISSS